jgi:hypothetical protein
MNRYTKKDLTIHLEQDDKFIGTDEGILYRTNYK